MPYRDRVHQHNKITVFKVVEAFDKNNLANDSKLLPYIA